MGKWCMNYETGETEYIERDGYSWDRGEMVYQWDKREYEREEEENRRREEEEEEDRRRCREEEEEESRRSWRNNWGFSKSIFDDDEDD